jgi:hypothetical protein
MRVPPEPDLPLIHQRRYDVRSYRQSATELRLRGTVTDEKPPGVYFDDDQPLTVHHMVVDLVVSFPALEIRSVEVVLETHPHQECVRIEEAYQKLVGVSIARGFSRTVKDLFGGPRGCTHVGALLQAMAPVAIQSTWSMQALSEGEIAVTIDRSRGAEGLRDAMRFNLNTCHVWAEDGEIVSGVLRGDELPPPVWAVERLRELGRDPDEWRTVRRGAPQPEP